MTNPVESPRRILIVGINHAPEQVGIGPYTTELAQWLCGAGYAVEVITAKPYYPAWRVSAEFRRPGYASSLEGEVRVTRCPIYVPAVPTGGRRVLHHLSFAASIVPPLVKALLSRRPDLLFVVAPSMISAPVARAAGRLCRSVTWLHVHDFEVGAAMATGLLASDGLRAKLARRFESFVYGGFDHASSVSPKMCARLETFGLGERGVFELRNWTDVQEIRPMAPRDSALWETLNPDGRRIVLYSGNISRKQGLESVVEAATLLSHRTDIGFVICGDGPEKANLMARARGLANVRFADLQPRERLNDLLGLGTVHLVPQIAGAADLMLPSKLINVLAAGKPAIATAAPGTGLEQEILGCGLLVPPADSRALADAVQGLVDDPGACERMGAAARARALERWSKEAILGRLSARLAELAPGAPARVAHGPPAAVDSKAAA